ncbi:MAG TPA: hypothetical protein VJ783_26915 [Pirellulales bacterium]|nr:hypothetical protein [Pirellulales bacterium]
MKAVRFSLAVSLLCLSVPCRGVAQETGLARLGNPPRIEIHGAESFKAEDICQRLLADLDVANARYPTTPVAEFCDLLTAKAREAYLYAGFADIAIESATNVAGDAIQMTIAEGKLYRAGDVVVRGEKNIDAVALARDLTIDDSPSELAAWKTSRILWKRGEPATLHQGAVGWYRDEVDAWLLDHGLVDSKLTVEIVPDREHALAALVITFADEGSPAVISEISVAGHQKNTHDEVLAYLGLQPGMTCTARLEAIVKKKLWESGRFIKSSARLVKPTEAGGPLKLAINVTEYPNAPPLKQELSREEAALVKLALWLNRFGDSDEEVAIRQNDGGLFEAVVAPKQGLIATIRAEDDEKPRKPFMLAFVMSDERLAFYSSAARRKIEGIPMPRRARGNFSLTLHDGPPTLTGQGRLEFGMAVSTRSKSHGLCRLRFGDTPVAMLSLAHEYDSKLSWKDDILTVEFREQTLSVDAATGQLVEHRSSFDDTAVTLTRTKGEFDRLKTEILSAAADYPQGDSSKGPLAGAVDLYCDTALAFLTRKDDANERSYFGLIRRLSNLGLFEPLDRMVLAACGAPEEEFYIPDDRLRAFWWDGNGVIDLPAVKYAGGSFGARLTDWLMMPGSWPNETWREAMLALASKSRHLEKELIKHLSAADSGPVRHLIVGELLRANDMGAMARVFGMAGQAHLSSDDFRHDYSAFLDGDTFIGHCLLTWTDVIRHLSDVEIQTLCKMLVEDGWLDDAQARHIADLARYLRRDPKATAATALSGALDAWWQAGLRESVKNELQELAAPPKPADHWRYRWHRGRWWYYGQNGHWQYWTGNAWRALPTATAGRARPRR